MRFPSIRFIIKYLLIIGSTASITLFIASWYAGHFVASTIVSNAQFDAVAQSAIIDTFEAGKIQLGIDEFRQQLCSKRATLRMNLDHLSENDRQFVVTYLENTSKDDAACNANELYLK